MKKLIYLFSFAALTTTTTTAFADCSRVDAEFRIFDTYVAQLKNDFAQLKADPKDKTWVSKKIEHMVEVDQYMRNTTQMPFEKSFDSLETQCFWQALGPRWQKIDEDNTAELQSLMKIYGWFWISQFGNNISDKAWLLAQHADRDRLFQKLVLGLMEAAYPSGEVSSENYAFLYDRVTWYADNKPQRYATQGFCLNGEWQPHPTEDFSQVNLRRKQMGMTSFEENKIRLDEFCSKVLPPPVSET